MELAYLLEPSFQIVDKSGNPLSNGYIEVYIAGTSTKYYCYSDFGGSLHPFRIPLDALGSNIILASTGLIYDVFIYNQFGTMVMSRHRITSKITSSTSGHSYIVVEGTEGQITVESSGSTDITYKVGLDDVIINELSGIHSDISSTSSYFENKINTEINDRTTADGHLQDQINNLDIHNIAIEQFGTGNAFTSITKDGDTYTFRKEKTYLQADKAPIVLAGENVEVTAANTDGRTIYTIKANPAGNVTNLISTDDTVSISSTSVGNDVTYDLSVKDIAGENGAKNYAFLTSEMPVNTSQMALEYTDVHTNGIEWNTIDWRLEFDEQIKLIDLNFNLSYEIDTPNGVSYEDLILYIYSDDHVLDQQTYSIDTSKSKFVCIWNKKILDPSNLQFLVKAPKAGSVNATIDINDETFKSIGSSVSGSTYYAGLNINISDDVISGRDWTPELNHKLDTSAFALPNSANGDDTYNTVLSNSATWNEGGSSPKNFFATRRFLSSTPMGVEDLDPWIKFVTFEPATDLSSNTYQDTNKNVQWITSEIVIPKEMKLFNVKLNFAPYRGYIINLTEPQPTYTYHNFYVYLNNTEVGYVNIEYDNSMYSPEHEKSCLIYNPISADSVLRVRGALDWFGHARININDET